jgi:hypothetical protein
MIDAGPSVPVPLYQATGPGLTAENFDHVVSSAALSGDLAKAVIESGTFLPVCNLDRVILQDTGVPVASYVNCFVRGTRFRTRDGDTPIETLGADDRVVTREGSARPIPRDSARCVSPNHALYLDNVPLTARFLIDDARITWESCATVAYFHLELACHDIVFAAGLPSESYPDRGDRGDFSNGEGGHSAVSGSGRIAVRRGLGSPGSCAAVPRRRARGDHTRQDGPIAVPVDRRHSAGRCQNETYQFVMRPQSTRFPGRQLCGQSSYHAGRFRPAIRWHSRRQVATGRWPNYLYSSWGSSTIAVDDDHVCGGRSTPDEAKTLNLAGVTCYL